VPAAPVQQELHRPRAKKTNERNTLSRVARWKLMLGKMSHVKVTP